MLFCFVLFGTGVLKGIYCKSEGWLSVLIENGQGPDLDLNLRPHPYYLNYLRQVMSLRTQLARCKMF